MDNLVDVFFMLLATMGPIKVSIVFAEKIRDLAPAIRRRIAFKAVGVATAVGLLFIFAGNHLMEFFYFSVAALTLAGGLILLIFAIRMVLTEDSSHQTEPYSDDNALDMAIYPFGVPMMASPAGLVVLTILSASTSVSDENLLEITAVLLLVMLINLIILLLEGKFVKFINRGFLHVAERILGILLAALAMQMLITGLQELGIIAIQSAGH